MPLITHITELTRAEFNQKLKKSDYGWAGDELCCPCDTAECSELICPKGHNDRVSCTDCWNNAIENLHFVGENEV